MRVAEIMQQLYRMAIGRHPRGRGRLGTLVDARGRNACDYGRMANHGDFSRVSTLVAS